MLGLLIFEFAEADSGSVGVFLEKLVLFSESSKKEPTSGDTEKKTTI